MLKTTFKNLSGKNDWLITSESKGLVVITEKEGSGFITTIKETWGCGKIEVYVINHINDEYCTQDLLLKMKGYHEKVLRNIRFITNFTRDWNIRI